MYCLATSAVMFGSPHGSLQLYQVGGRRSGTWSQPPVALPDPFLALTAPKMDEMAPRSGMPPVRHRVRHDRDEDLAGAKEDVIIGGKRRSRRFGTVQGHGVPIEETGLLTNARLIRSQKVTLKSRVYKHWALLILHVFVTAGQTLSRDIPMRWPIRLCFAPPVAYAAFTRTRSMNRIHARMTSARSAGSVVAPANERAGGADVGQPVRMRFVGEYYAMGSDDVPCRKHWCGDE
jgi:hypothetical protein